MPLRYLMVLLFLVALLVTVIQLGVLTIAFQKLGLSPHAALWLVLAALAGSGINIPLVSVTSSAPSPPPPEIPAWGRIWQPVTPAFTGKMVIAVNLGGCLIPAGMCLYLLFRQLVDPLDLLPATLIVTLASYAFSRPIPGIGIGMPVIIAPGIAAITAILLAPANAAPLAFTSGVLGVILGADILRMKDTRRMGATIASIGGAGTFDGIFLTGIVAALLA